MWWKLPSLLLQMLGTARRRCTNCEWERRRKRKTAQWANCRHKIWSPRRCYLSEEETKTTKQVRELLTLICTRSHLGWPEWSTRQGGEAWAPATLVAPRALCQSHILLQILFTQHPLKLRFVKTFHRQLLWCGFLLGSPFAWNSHLLQSYFQGAYIILKCLVISIFRKAPLTCLLRSFWVRKRGACVDGAESYLHCQNKSESFLFVLSICHISSTAIFALTSRVIWLEEIFASFAAKCCGVQPWKIVVNSKSAKREGERTVAGWRL